MKKVIFFAVLMSLFGNLKAQENPKIWGKFNAPALLIGVPQIGIEYHFSPSWSYQTDILGSFWKSFLGIPLEIGMFSQEARYYFDKRPERWFVAGNLSGAVYRLQKWEYWNTNYIQKGFSGFLGITLGYVWQFNDHLKGEIFIGAGTQQARYKGVDKTTGERLDPITFGGWNKSGEIIPYRGGFMLAIPLN